MQTEKTGGKTKPEFLLEYLSGLAIPVTVYNHPPVFTVAEAVQLRGTIPGAHSKNLFLVDRKKNHYLVSALENCEIDLKRLHLMVGAKGKFSFASAEAMGALLGVIPGAVSPFGLLNDIGKICKIVLDQNFFHFDGINFHPLDNSVTCTISPNDLLKFLTATGHSPQIVDLAH